MKTETYQKPYLAYVGLYVRLDHQNMSFSHSISSYPKSIVHSLSTNPISHCSTRDRKTSFYRQEQEQNKAYLYPFLCIPLWSLPLPTGSNTSVKSLLKVLKEKIGSHIRRFNEELQESMMAMI